MKVDCFTFFNELDILEIRLEELYPVVDAFVLVESKQTFRGQDKPLFFAENRDRFSKWADKIVHIQTDDKSIQFSGKHGMDSWEREYYQRNKITAGLDWFDLEPDDIVMISDVDEIPRRAVVETINPDPIISIDLDVFIYGINILTEDKHTVKAIKYSELTTPQEIRMLPPDILIPHGGWEFTSLGDAEHISLKLRSFAHWELDSDFYTNPELIKQRIAAKTDLLGQGRQFKAVEIDDTWPEAIKNNRGYWSKYEH